MDLSFSGAGFMGCYYFGVVNCWNKYIPRDRVRRVAGASAGSLIAAYYLMELPLDGCLKEIIEMTEDIRRRPMGVFDRSNQIVDILPERLDRMFPEDAHKRVSGRLFVCMTRLKDMKCVIVNEFETKKDLIDALNCSCFIPVWSGNHVSTYKGTKYIDGGFTNNLPVFDEHTIRVCCFSGASDIAPYDRAQSDFMSGSLMGMPMNFTWKNMQRVRRALWPPPASYIIELLERGFHDAKNFILTNDLIQCNSCFKATELELQPVFARAAPTISPAASPSVSRASSYMNLADLQRSGSFRRRDVEPDPITAATIRQLEGMLSADQKGLPSVFEARRSKSGKQITLAALGQPERRPAGHRRPSFAGRLRKRFGRPAKAPPAAAGLVPTIVVDQPAPAPAPAGLTIEEIMKKQEEDSAGPTQLVGPKEGSLSRASSRSASSAGSQNDHDDRHEHEHEHEHNENQSDADDQSDGDQSGDSAIGGLRRELASPLSRPASQSPAEKYLASRKMSLVASQLDLQRQEARNELSPDRFAFAPSQLPSCPPSPNLNRHCSECIRMRQLARMDEIDQLIKCEAQKYGSLVSRDPEKEFNGIRYKLVSWFRQLATPRYSYDMRDPLVAAGGPQAAPAAQRRPSEIPTFN